MNQINGYSPIKGKTGKQVGARKIIQVKLLH